MCKNSLLSDLVFNKEGFSSLLECKSRAKKRFCSFIFSFLLELLFRRKRDLRLEFSKFRYTFSSLTRRGG